MICFYSYHVSSFVLVRDYVLGKVEEDRKGTGGLKLLQRAFVSEFLASQEEWEVVAGEAIPRYERMRHRCVRVFFVLFLCYSCGGGGGDC